MLTSNGIAALAVLGQLDCGSFRAIRYEDAQAEQVAAAARHEPGYRPATRQEVVEALRLYPELERDGDLGAVLHDDTVVAMGHHCDAGMHRSEDVEETALRPGSVVMGVLILLVAER